VTGDAGTHPAPPIPADESARRTALAASGLLDGEDDHALAELAVVAAEALEVPAALVSVIDRDRQVILANVGLDLASVDRADAFCAHAIVTPSEVMAVTDMRADHRFAHHPLVVGEPHIRFYAGAPIVVGGHGLGTVAVLDHQPRDLSPREERVLRNLAGHVAGLVEVRQAAAAASRARGQLDAVLAATSDAIAVVSGEGEVIWLDDDIARVAGEDLGAGDDILTLLHAGARDAARAALQSLVRRGPGARTRADLQLPNGRWLEVEGTNRIEDPSLGGIVLAMRDITRRRRTEQDLRSRTALLETIFDAMREAVVQLDAEGKLVRANAAAQAWVPELGVGGDTADWIARLGIRQVHGQEQGTTPDAVDAALAGQSTDDLQVTLPDPDGEERIALLNLRPLPDEAGGGIVVTARDVTHEKEIEAALVDMASNDPLTGLANRRSLSEALEVASAGDALVLVDLDGFKAVNDGHGHHMGDAVLVEVATRLRSLTRSGDLAARLGGDELALVVRRTNDDDLAEVAERLRKVVEAPMTIEGATVSVGASLGMARLGPTIDGDAALRRADQQMYADKLARRASADVHRGSPTRPAAPGRRP
jgi:diguanylate cyclase